MSWLKTRNRVDLIGGVVLLFMGLGAILEGSNYTIGTLGRMGPGFFPVILGVCLALIGVLVVVTSGGGEEEEEEAPMGPPDWRGWGCIVAGVILFMAVGAWLGLVAATFALVFVSAMGDRDQTLGGAAVLAVGISALGLVLFGWLLKLQFPLFPWS